MRIAYVAAGAGGMYCGSCLHDNTLAAALQRAGHEVALLPTYTPMRTDEDSVSSKRIFYGAINVYLQQKSGLFRRTPRFVDRLFDRPGLLRWIARRASTTDAHELGDLTLAVLRGEDGPQRKELERLVAWLRDDFRPEVVHLTNSMFLGMAGPLVRALGVPVAVNVQGEDLFLDQLPAAARQAVVAELVARAGDATAFVAPNRYYARHMAEILGVEAGRMHVVPLGIQLHDHEEPPLRPARRRRSVGYLARICPEKGLDQLVSAFLALHADGDADLSLRVAGYVDPGQRRFLSAQVRRLENAGLADRVEVLGEVDRAAKLDFLRSLDLLAVPTAYREAKGLFALEAMAAGVPVLVPAHGAFPEMIDDTGGGALFEPNSPDDLAAAIRRLFADPAGLRALGSAGRRAVLAGRGADAMAEATVELYRELLSGPAAGERSA